MNHKLEYRMYGLVPYNISPIQQGIQFGHAVVEYGLQYAVTPEYLKWAKEDKTFIILNGGTTNSRFSIVDGLPLGSLNRHALTLAEMGARLSTFSEPDLGDQLAAVVFLVDERVFNRTKYPDPIETDEATFAWTKEFSEADLEKIFSMRVFLQQFRLA
jgi:hypothetical protein